MDSCGAQGILLQAARMFTKECMHCIWQTAQRLVVIALTDASPPPSRTTALRQCNHVLSVDSASQHHAPLTTTAASCAQHGQNFKLKPLQCGYGCRSRAFPPARSAARLPIQGSTARPCSMQCVNSPENPESERADSGRLSSGNGPCASSR